MASTFNVIQHIELSSAGAITFTSIPSTYTDLVLITSMNANPYQDLRMVINNDTTASNYSYRGHSGYVSGSTSTATVFKSGSYSGMLADYESLPSPVQGGHINIFHLMAYTSSDYKLSIALGAHLDNIYQGVDFVTSTWKGTSAVTSIGLVPGNATIGSGSFSTLYGIKSA